jgi:formylglycine-generating enzyme required for sulfatase activity
VVVGTYAPDSYGLYDIGSNVWEWYQDYYNASLYTVVCTTDPVHTTAGADSKKIRRDGSWNYHSANLVTHARTSDFENGRNNHFGFRLVHN